MRLIISMMIMLVLEAVMPWIGVVLIRVGAMLDIVMLVLVVMFGYF